jgi:hypothetical protein
LANINVNLKQLLNEKIMYVRLLIFSFH